jgi:DNA polymerase-1
MSTRPYEIVSTLRRLKQVLRECKREGVAALDFETTSLYPEEGRVRLCQICNDDVRVVIDFWEIRGRFERHAHLFDNGVDWIVFYKGFEQRWFDHQINGRGRVDKASMPNLIDVANMRRSVLGGGNYSLKNMVKWDLDIDISKGQQTSNWGAKVLRPEQYDYAWDDAAVTWAAYLHWHGRMDAEHWDGARMLDDMVPAVIEMETTGMQLDAPTHRRLIKSWEQIRDLRIKRIRRAVGEDEVANINSDIQWSNYFAQHMPDEFLDSWPRTEKSGQLSMTTETLGMLASWTRKTPLEKFFDALSQYKTISKYLSSFGETLLTHALLSNDGRIHASYNIGAAKTDRFSSSGPNLQQVPRNRDLLGVSTSVRRSLVAPRGRRLVSLDYSGIELRVLALLSGDKQLLEDVVHGDVHSEVAAVIAGRPIDKTTAKGKALRNSAKPVSFGIIYGSAAFGLSNTMRCSIDRAQEYIDFWQDRYPNAFGLRHEIVDEAARAGGFVRMRSGCTIYLTRRAPVPKAANYPVQHGAWAVMARAIIRHKNTLDWMRASRERLRTTRMLSTIHDALIDETHHTQARRVLNIMRNDMTQGFTDVFPGESTENLLEGGIGQNWGELS